MGELAGGSPAELLGLLENLSQVSADATPEGRRQLAALQLHAVGLLDSFDPVIISGDFGFRKPDQRLFEKALTIMRMKPPEVLFVGNDMYRDVYGARNLGIKTVFFRSNQGQQEKEGVEPDYIIYTFPELLNALRFFEEQ